MEVEQGDTVIISAKPVPGNELRVHDTINRLARSGAEVLHQEIAPVHVSGHGHAEELRTVLAVLRPKNVMPVHGEFRMLAAHARLSFAEAAAYEFVGLSDSSSIGTRIRTAAANAGIAYRTAMQVTTFEALRRMVQAGMGLGILPESCSAPYAQGLGLACIPLADDWASYHLSLCVRRADALPTATRLLFHFLSEQAAES